MLLEQFFDRDTYTYTYLIADENQKLAALIDPVDTHVSQYIEYLNQRQLALCYVLDTHTHADHISANGKLREITKCTTCIAEQAESACIDKTLRDGDTISIGNINVVTLYTPGHTNDSLCFFIDDADAGQAYLFTGDTLLINGSGRTDFQNGNAEEQYQSIFERLLNYPDETVVYPGHDYNGKQKSTIGKEKRQNPRLQYREKSEYVAFMNNLKLPNPKYMDIAVPANQSCGKADA